MYPARPDNQPWIVAIYKPERKTSFDIVAAVRHVTRERRVGHAGTLDPMARGVLVVGIGRDATRQLGALARKDKEYIATLRLGWVSHSGDREGPFEERPVEFRPSPEQIEAALACFRGRILQTPPAHSAVKIGGRSAYSYARQQIDVKIEPRPVEIFSLELLRYEWPLLELRAVTGAGVYIRTLAADLGEKLGTGAYLDALERTRVGDFTKDMAIPLENIDRLNPDYHRRYEERGP